MTDSTDLESLISSTLTALDAKAETVVDCFVTNEELSTQNDLDDCLTKIREAAPQVESSENGPTSDDDSLSRLLDGLLSPSAILDSMEGLSVELEKYLQENELSDSTDLDKYRRQLVIYKDISAEFKLCPDVAESDSTAGGHVRELLAELQSLGPPPAEVVEKLMGAQLSENGADDLGKEFEEFMKAAGGAAGIPGLTPEDEEMIKQLTKDPNALKNLLGNKPGDCCIS